MGIAYLVNLAAPRRDHQPLLKTIQVTDGRTDGR